MAEECPIENIRSATDQELNCEVSELNVRLAVCPFKVTAIQRNTTLLWIHEDRVLLFGPFRSVLDALKGLDHYFRESQPVVGSGEAANRARHWCSFCRRTRLARKPK